MNRQSKDDLARHIASRPLYQGLIILLFSSLFALIGRGGDELGAGTPGQSTAWIMMTAAVLFYALCSSVLSLMAKDQGRYWRDAILTFIGFAAAAIGMATLISGMSIDEAGSFRWLFVVLAVGYLVFCAIVRLIKKIVDIAVKQDDRLRGE